jgi:hypothetical protein
MMHWRCIGRWRVILIGVVACHIVGCTTVLVRPQSKPELSAEFAGYWANIVAGYENWWVIGPHSVVNYGTALGGGRCTGDNAVILGRDRMEVPFGNAGAVSLSISDGLLLFSMPNGIAGHRRVPRADICRKANGEYYVGAPYVGG